MYVHDEQPGDATPPVLTVPADLGVGTDAGQAAAVVNFGGGVAASEQRRPGPVRGVGPPSGNTFELGTTEVTWTATGAAGNTAHASFDITVIDNEAPSIQLCLLMSWWAGREGRTSPRPCA